MHFSLNAKTVCILTLTVGLLTCLKANASTITLNDLTPVYTANPPFLPEYGIEINWLTPITITSVNYSNITSINVEAAIKALPGTVVQGYYGNNSNNIQNITLPDSPTVDVFFVDSITSCGGVAPIPGDRFVGCSFSIPNNSFAVVGTDAASAIGQELEAHELGHDLGLQHCEVQPVQCGGAPLPNGVWDNLMAQSTFGSTKLTSDQEAIILTSPLVQNFNRELNVCGQGGCFIDLQPITFVPEPSSLELMSCGLVILFAARRFRRVAAHSRK